MENIFNNILIFDQFALTPLDLDWLVGFLEADGSFSIASTGYTPVFELTQHIADFQLIERIKYILGGEGIIVFGTKEGDFTCVLKYRTIKDLIEIIIPFVATRLVTERKKGQLNNLSKHPKLAPILSQISSKGKLTTRWLSGFVDGDGTFFITFKKAKDMVMGYQAQLVFEITQFYSSELLAQINTQFFQGKGKITDNGNRLRITDRKVIKNIVVSLFNKSPLLTRKRIDFILFKSALSIMEKGGHLTPEGFNKLKTIQLKMHLNRAGVLFSNNYLRKFDN